MAEENKSSLSKESAVSLFDAFDLLRSSTENAKVNGAAKIVAQLHGTEVQKDVTYALRRLIRSLGANVAEMRIGYFGTLVSLFNRLEEVSVKDILSIAHKELHANGSTKSEIGDVALGQILVCGAILRSKLIFKCDADEQKQIIQLLLSSGNKKSYLSVIAYNLLLDLSNRVNEEQFSAFIWPNIKQDFKKEIKELSLDSIYFLLVVGTKFPNTVKLRKLIGAPSLLHEDFIPDICEKLMSGIDLQTSGHPIYAQIGKDVATCPQLVSLWTKIDSYLVKHNRNRELAALNILNAILNNLQNGSALPTLLGDNLLKLLMDWFKGLQTASKIRNKKDDEDDHRIMVKKGKEVLVSLTKALKLPSVDNHIRVIVLKKLLLSPGEINFTEISGSSVIKTLIADLDIEGLKKMSKIFKKILLNTSQKSVKENVERKWYNNERVKAAELLSYIVCHEKVKDDIEFKISNMQLLMCLAFFKTGGDDHIAVSSELAGSIKTCFYRCFTTRFSNVNNLVTVLSSLSSFISKIMKKEQILEKLEKQFSKENMECWNVHLEICNKIEESNCNSKVDKVFLILLHQLGLFLFSEPTHVKISQSCIMELKSCYEHYKKGKKKQKNKKNDSISEEEPEWIEVVIEVLLSILSVDSSVLRSVVQCVFRLLCENLTPTCMEQIVSVLDPESESNPLTNDSNSDEESEDDSETKEIKPVENGNASDSNDEDDDNESDSEIEDDDEEMKTPDQLRLAVQKALGSAVVPDSDTESLDADMITEEEGQKLDEALAEAFRQFHQGKNQKSKKERKGKKALSDFRIRVLDLIEIYLEKDPQMDICLAMISPLTKALEFCLMDNQLTELQNKIRKTLKSFSKIKKFSATGDLSVETLANFLQSIIEKRERSQFLYQALGDVITSSATFIINCYQKIQAEESKSSKTKKKSPLLTVLKTAMDNFFTSRSCLLPIIFFHKILQIQWEGTYDLMEIIVDNIFNENVRHFRRNEGLELMMGYYRALCRNKPSTKNDIVQILNIEKMFLDKFTVAFTENRNTEVKKNFLVTLRKLINIIRSYHESSKVTTNLDFKSMTVTLSSVNTTSAKAQPQNHNNNNNQKKKNKKRKIVNGDSSPAKKVKNE
ncbi:uncharacterized protein LOC121727737 [Aricia agestis]|uniref:uncharacterized protein LOC121727737 n=1 Tax=Aricia agestis TaxID=91739 RepID=UPI001C207CC8|nr:uncharacterized protein LOC121727737 [Aricia agestis]